MRLFSQFDLRAILNKQNEKIKEKIEKLTYVIMSTFRCQLYHLYLLTKAYKQLCLSGNVGSVGRSLNKFN